MLGSIAGFTIAAVFIVLLADAVYSFTKQTGTFKERLLAIGKTSATIAVARLGAIGGLGLDYLAPAADLLGSPAVASALTQYVNSKAVGYTLALSAVVVELSRRRSLRVTVDDPTLGITTVKAPLVGVVEPVVITP